MTDTPPAKIEPWMRLAARVIADEWMRNWSSDTLSMRIDSIAAIIAAHAPKQEPLSKSVHKRLIAQGAIDPSVPVSKLKEFERELQWGSSIKRLRRLFTDIIHEAEQEKQP